MKTVWYKHTTPRNNKAQEFQVTKQLILDSQIDIKLTIWDEIISFLGISIFGIFELGLSYTIKCDHAGFTLDLRILGLGFHYNYYDIRHWNSGNNKWEEHK